MATTETEAKPGKAEPKLEKVTFLSRSPNQRLVFEFGDVIRNERGRVVEQVPSRAIEFVDQGAHGEWVFDPDDESRDEWMRSAELLAWLRRHPNFNSGQSGSFWERGAAPDEPKPTVLEQMDKINAGTFERDRKAVEDVLANERETHDREAVIAAAESALSRLDEEDAKPREESAGSDEEPSLAQSQT